MSTHHQLTTATQSTSDTVEERATPWNRPLLQTGSYRERSAPVDPTAAPIATGGSLMLNDSDRSGLNEWFHSSFKNQFKYKTSWFGGEWFPEFFAPMRDTINHNFNKAFDTIRKNEEEVVKLRKEVKDEMTKLRKDNAKLRIEMAMQKPNIATSAERSSSISKTLAIVDEVLHG